MGPRVAYLGKTSPFRMLGLLVMALALLCFAQSIHAQAMSTADFLASLSDSEIEEFQAWKSARRDFDAQLDEYWDAVELEAPGA